MTTFYEELCTAAGAKYITGENKKQALLTIVNKWTKKNQIIESAMAGKINLETLVAPIVQPNTHLSFCNRENDTFESTDFREWSKRLFQEIGNILPLKESLVTAKGSPIALWVPVKTSQFYNMKRHWLGFLSITTAILLLWGISILSSDSSTSVFTLFGWALFGGIILSSFQEMIFVLMDMSLHIQTRQRMAQELLRQTRTIDSIFREASLF